VSIDPNTGLFDGYAWGENTGWIHFAGSNYSVKVSEGDINGDGRIDVLDVRLCLQIADGILTGSAEQRNVADIDGDGDIDQTDAEILAEYVLDIRPTLP